METPSIDNKTHSLSAEDMYKIEAELREQSLRAPAHLREEHVNLMYSVLGQRAMFESNPEDHERTAILSRVEDELHVFESESMRDD
jgi:hypothetical protein